MKKAISAAILCMALFTACNGNNNSEYLEKESAQNITTTVTTLSTTVAETTVATTTTAAETTTSTAVKTTTTAEATTTTVGTTTKEEYPPIRDISETDPPFGDLHGAYVCIGGLAVYPSVYVLTEDEVSKLADYFNSEIWTEESMEDYVPPTGSMGLTYYIYKDGKYSSLSDLGAIYYSDGVRRSFRETRNDDDYSSPLSAYDFLYTGDSSRQVSTHINEPNAYSTYQEYLELIWNDVLQWIEKNGY